jgi:hypothetical protein
LCGIKTIPSNTQGKMALQKSETNSLWLLIVSYRHSLSSTRIKFAGPLVRKMSGDSLPCHLAMCTRYSPHRAAQIHPAPPMTLSARQSSAPAKPSEYYSRMYSRQQLDRQQVRVGSCT